MIRDSVFQFIYGCAMPDAIQQSAFPHFESRKRKISNNAKSIVIYNDGNYVPSTQGELLNNALAKKVIKDFVDKILDPHITYTDQEQYNRDFFEVATTVKNIFKKKSEDGKIEYYEFTFGNIQKLINMTLKHLYVCTYSNAALRQNFKFCHCPIDSRSLQE